MSWLNYMETCSFADIAVAELSTLASFHAESHPELLPAESTDILLSDFDFCIVRINDVSDFIIADASRKRVFTVPYYRNGPSLRFTDRVIAQVVRQYVSNPDRLFDSDDWIMEVSKTVEAPK